MAQGYFKEQFESIPGNETNAPTLSTKVMYEPIQSAGLKLGSAHLSRDDENRNQDEPLPVITDRYNPSWEFASRMYPDTVGWRLKHILGAPTTATGDGIITDQNSVAVPVGAYRHRWTAPFGPTGASPLTSEMVAAYKDQSVFFKLKGAACDTMGIDTPEEGGATISASGPGNYHSRIADPSLTPAYEALAVRPFVRGNLLLPTWLTSTSTHENFGVSISNPVENVSSLGIASKFPDVMEKDAVGAITFTGSLAQRQLGTADWDALLGATGFTAKASWTSDSIIASAYPYKLFITFSNCQYVEGEAEALANRRRHGAEFTWKSSTPSAGSTVVELVNATTTYV